MGLRIGHAHLLLLLVTLRGAATIKTDAAIIVCEIRWTERRRGGATNHIRSRTRSLYSFQEFQQPQQRRSSYTRKGPMADFLTISKFREFSWRALWRACRVGWPTLASARQMCSPATAAALLAKQLLPEFMDCQYFAYWAYLLLVLY